MISKFEDTFVLLCDVVIKETANVVILGDFNCDQLKNDSLSTICDSFDIHNLVSSPTCFKNPEGTLIDVCLVTKPLRFKNTLNIDCWLSDFHNFICVTTKLQSPKTAPNVIQYRSMKNFDKEHYVSDLYSLSDAMPCNVLDVNLCTRTLCEHLTNVIESHAPIKTKTIRNRGVPYMNSELRKLQYQRNMARNAKNKHPSRDNHEKYRKLRNKCVKMRLSSQRKYFKQRCDGGPKSQNFWPTIKPFLSNKNRNMSNIMLCENDAIVNDLVSVANIFNKYFTDIADKIGFNDPIPVDYRNDDVFWSMVSKYDNHPSIIAIKGNISGSMSFEFSKVTVNELYNILVKLNVRKATGFDGIPSKFLRIGAAPLAALISDIVNMSISECTFSDILKYAEIASLFKRLDSLKKENYRPVSVLTALSKIFENVFNMQMSQYFDLIFSNFLSGFRHKYSCQTTLVRMIEEWKEALDNGKMVGAVAVDLSKAFDSLPHGLLIAKLVAYGMDIKSCKLISSYLFNRYQRVKVGSSKSDWRQIKRGVPQGSTLGPLLFNVFINDIFFMKTDCSIFNYADDNCLSLAGTTTAYIENTLAKETEILKKWFKENSLEANPTKFQSMLISSKGEKETDLSLVIDGIEIDPANNIKVLGITIDQCLKFNKHIADMCSKAGRQLNVLQRLRGSLDFDSHMAIYKTFIISNFNYCPLVWMFSSKKSLTNIENIQKRALRFVNNDYTSSFQELLINSGVSGIRIMTLRSLAIEVYKCVKQINPVYLNDMFTRKKCPYELRNELLVRPKVNTTNYGLKSVRSYGSKIWNLLPQTYKEAVTTKEFKSVIRSWNGPQCSCAVCDLFTK